MAITSSIENRRCAFTLHAPSDDATTAAIAAPTPGLTSTITIAPGPSTMVPYSDHLAACGLHQFLDCVTTIAVWFFGHGLHGLRCVIGRDAVQHCEPPCFDVARNVNAWRFHNDATPSDCHV